MVIHEIPVVCTTSILHIRKEIELSIINNYDNVRRPNSNQIGGRRGRERRKNMSAD